MNTIESQNYSQFQMNGTKKPERPPQNQGFQNNSHTYNLQYDQTVLSQNVPTQNMDPRYFQPQQNQEGGYGGYNFHGFPQSQSGAGGYTQPPQSNNPSGMGNYSNNEREVMGDTVQSMEYTNQNNRTRMTGMGEKEIMGDTINSMGTVSHNQTGFYADRTGHTVISQNMPSGTFSKKSDYEDRPIKSSGTYNVGREIISSGHYNLDAIDDGYNFQKKGMNNTIREDDDEYWSDDFEDSDDGAPDTGRITNVADEIEMSAVMDIYQDFFNDKGGISKSNKKLATIRENSYEDSSTRLIDETNLESQQSQDKHINNKMMDTKKNMRSNLINKLGKDNFEYVYNYLRVSREKNLDEKDIVFH